MRWKGFVLLHLSALFLIGTFLWPVTSPLWATLDEGVFRVLNSTLQGHPDGQLFWALLNHRLVDWFGDIVMLLFFIVYVATASRELRLRKICECLCIIFLLAAVIYFINRVLFRQTLRIPRESPSLIFDWGVRVSDYIHGFSIKDTSTKSFPGDHATTALFFATCYTFFAGWRLGKWAIAWAIFISLPRVILGAHWFSDVAMGSGSIVLICSAWAFCTPLHLWITSAFHRLLARKAAITER